MRVDQQISDRDVNNAASKGTAENTQCIDYGSTFSITCVLLLYFGGMANFAVTTFAATPRFMTKSEYLPIHFPNSNSTGRTFDVKMSNLPSTANLIPFHGPLFA
jgi:hypothetical protein